MTRFVSAVLGLLCGGFLLGGLSNSAARAGGTYTVTNLNDSGIGSLRAAITSADSDSGAIITFQSGVSGTLALASAEPTFTGQVTIQGPSSAQIILDGGQKYRVFRLASGASVTLSNLTIQDGSDQVDGLGGGGIANLGGTLTLSGCAIVSNSAAQGGGVFSRGGATTFTNCTLVFNTATADGGGFCNDAGVSGAVATLTGCTIGGNTAATGGGVSNRQAGARTAFGNDILYFDSGGEIADGAGSVTATYCDIMTSAPNTPPNAFTDSGHNLSADPHFGSLQDNGGPTPTVALLTGSPCVGVGTPTLPVAVDQRGIARPAGSIDLGAYQTVTPKVQSGLLLWANTDGIASVWNFADPDPAATCKLYGPFSGWTPQVIAQGPDEHGRLLWTNTDGRAALWNLADGNPVATCSLYGPFPGWTAHALTVGPDNAAHLLWDNADGRVSLWNTTDPSPSATCLIVGPYSGWSGVALGFGADNHARLLWDNVNGQASVWNLSDPNPAATCTLYGPYSGWAAHTLAVGPDNAAHLLWDNTNGQVSLWNLAALNPAATCVLYGPYGGWFGRDLGVGSDGFAHLLWDNLSGQMSLWNLADSNPAATCVLYGPYSGWTAVSIAGLSEMPDTTVIGGQTVSLSAVPSGLKSYDTVVGTGVGAVSGQTLSVQYTGRLLDGTKFDSSYDHGGTPFSFTLGAGQVIAGWDQGVLGMKVGGTRRLVIPSRLAYGAHPPTATIPPNAILVFDIVLVSAK